jgi:glycosyltransferase involved in cell wall biosynthesis
MISLSVIVPIKDERDNVRPLHERLHTALDPLEQSYELIFVDDGSTDDSYALLEELASVDPCVKVVRLRRNFGQTAALQAGIDFSSGAILVTMDGDLQNDPADIPMLLAKLAEGYDAVLGQRANRQDHLLSRKLPSLLANWLIRKVTGVEIRDMGCTLRAMRRDLAEALPLYGEMHRFVPVLAQQYGGRLAQVPVRHHPRVAGRTKYNLSRTVRVLLDLMTVKFLHTYLTRPMHVLGLAGLLSMGLGGVSLVATLAMKWGAGVDMTGNPLLLLSALLELVGVQLISMGLLGELLTRTYFESQGKTSYAVRTTLNLTPGPLREESGLLMSRRVTWNEASGQDRAGYRLSQSG